MNTTRFSFLGTLAIVALVGCDTPTDPEVAPIDSELAAALAGTGRYEQLANALADGYVDIDLCIPGQGCHFLNAALIDAEFDPRQPEILMYSPQGDSMILVGLEYAVPYQAENVPGTAPDGFTGEADVWHAVDGFQLWLLHAWVWRNNPDGMFADLNPLVP